ncbi:MAG: L-serine ammonia-lyase [Spirochaetaceae bacterium]|jgi:L-serine dehydratase|nr:L-serine ammonia-lyase [Spirochaetaceae bacterium]
MTPKKIISLSIFDLLKIGPGPSSSHTIAPMKGGFDFTRRVAQLPPELLGQARGIRVRLFGSLSATGKGHGTDRAIIAGLMGYASDKCPPTLLNDIRTMNRESIFMQAGREKIHFGLENIFWGPVSHDFSYANTFIIDLLSTEYPPPQKNGESEENLNEKILFSWEYYSVGGGFLQWKGWEAPKYGPPIYPYTNMADVINIIEKDNLPLSQMMIENESAMTGESAESINKRLDFLIGVMKDTVIRGLSTDGKLPGSIGLMRKAKYLKDRAASFSSFERQICLLNAYAYAASEENAAGNMIVTAPTCGAAGVIPSLLMFMSEYFHLDITAQRMGLLAATLIGFIAKGNAAIAGAEVGCQGEIGVATAMGAAMLSCGRGYPIQIIADSAETGLEHQLGLTCDPVDGLVQIPCIERNAIAAVKACDAALIAQCENPHAHYVSFDDVLEAMRETGKDMNIKYKETSEGGLAVCVPDC